MVQFLRTCVLLLHWEQLCLLLAMATVSILDGVDFHEGWLRYPEEVLRDQLCMTTVSPMSDQEHVGPFEDCLEGRSMSKTQGDVLSHLWCFFVSELEMR
jgi:hypothetical protein